MEGLLTKPSGSKFMDLFRKCRSLEVPLLVGFVGSGVPFKTFLIREGGAAFLDFHATFTTCNGFIIVNMHNISIDSRERVNTM